MDQSLREVQNTVRLPIHSTQQRRAGTDAQVYSQAWGQKYINCYPEIYKDLISGETEMALVKRPGLINSAALTNTIASYGTGTTMVCWGNIAIQALTDVYVSLWHDSTASKLYVIQYRPLAGTTTKIGELTSVVLGDFAFISEITQDVGGTYPAGTLTPAIAIIFTNAARTTGAGYYATSSGGVFTAASLNAIASASFPSNLGTPKVVTGPIVQLDGTSYVMTTEGTIYGSGGTDGTLYDITSWNTNTIVAASMYPDKGVAVWRYKNAVLAFGQDSIEFFVDAQIPPPSSPLERTDQASIHFGVLSPKMILTIDDSVYFVSNSSTGTVGVWRLDGYTPVKISEPNIDFGIATAFSSNPDCRHSMEVLQSNYKKHLLINGPQYYTLGAYMSFGDADDYPLAANDLATPVVVYSIEDKIWWSWVHGDAVNSDVGFIYPAFTQSSSADTPWKQYIFLNLTVASTVNTGLYEWNNLNGPPGYADQKLGASTTYPITASIQFNTYWFGTEKKKRINKVKVISDPVYRGSGSDTHTYRIWFVYTRDARSPTDSANKVFSRSIDLTSTTEALGRYKIANLGMGRRWTFQIVLKHPGDFRVTGLELDIDQSTN